MDSSSHSEDLRSIHLVASELGVGVNTLKRFLDSNPELLKMVRKTKGGHWRVEATRENLGKLRDSLIIWKFWSRKGIVRPFVRTQDRNIIRKCRIDQKPTKMRERQDELDRVLWGLLLVRESGFVLTQDDYRRYLDLALSTASEKPEDNPLILPKEIKDAIGKGDTVTWKSLILYLAVQKVRQGIENVDGACRSSRSLAAVEIVPPTGGASIAALSREMRISRASLYRIFGARELQRLLKPDSSLRYKTKAEHQREERQM